MQSSPENTHSSNIVPGVYVLGTTLTYRYHVRCEGVGGVQEQGEAPQGLTRNTGYPSSVGLQSPIPPARRRAEWVGERSGSLSTCIVALEGWRTRDGEEPVSSEGGCLSFGINVWRHGLCPQR